MKRPNDAPHEPAPSSLDILSAIFSEADIPERRDICRSCYPPVCGVYALIDCDEIVYVGSSQDVTLRLQHHLANQRCGRIFNPVSSMQFSRAICQAVERKSLGDVEGALIRALNPRHNKGVAPKYRGLDNNILAGFGLPPHQDQDQYAAIWEAKRGKALSSARRRNK